MGDRAGCVFHLPACPLVWLLCPGHKVVKSLDHHQGVCVCITFSVSSTDLYTLCFNSRCNDDEASLLLLIPGLTWRLDKDFDVVDSGELSRCDLDVRLDSGFSDELFDRDECRESEVPVEFRVSLRLRSRLVGVCERFLFSFSSLPDVFSDVGMRCNTPPCCVRRCGVCGGGTGWFRRGKASNSCSSSSTDSL